MEFHRHASITLRSPPATRGPSPSAPGRDTSALPLDLIHELSQYAGFQGLSQRAIIPSGRVVASPTASLTDDIPREARDSNLNLLATVVPGDLKNVKRRLQNREAQRRFRERKEQKQKALQQNAENLRSEYQILLNQYNKSSSEVSRLVKENEVLRFEVRNLRQQWRLVLAVLGRLQQGSPSPSSIGGDAVPFDDLQCFPEELASGHTSSLDHYSS